MTVSSDAQIPGTFADKLSALREKFLISARQTLEVFRIRITPLADTPTSVDLLDALRHDLHRLRGTAGSFGYARISELAGVFEAQVRAWALDPSLDVGTRVAALTRFVEALEVELRGGER